MNQPDTKTDKPVNTSRLVELFEKLPENEQVALLSEWEDRFSKGKRTNVRKPFFMVVDYATEDGNYKDFIQDISVGGLFIETSIPFSEGRDISLTFPLPSISKHIKIAGEIARVNDRGIGIKFKLGDQEQSDMIKTLLENI